MLCRLAGAEGPQANLSQDCKSEELLGGSAPPSPLLIFRIMIFGWKYSSLWGGFAPFNPPFQLHIHFSGPICFANLKNEYFAAWFFSSYNLEFENAIFLAKMLRIFFCLIREAEGLSHFIFQIAAQFVQCPCEGAEGSFYVSTGRRPVRSYGEGFALSFSLARRASSNAFGIAQSRRLCYVSKIASQFCVILRITRGLRPRVMLRSIRLGPKGPRRMRIGG